MRKIILLVLFFLSPTSLAIDFDDYHKLGYHLEICNSCETAADFENVAKAAAVREKVVIANFNNGQIRSYNIERVFEPGYQDVIAIPTSTPNDVVNAKNEIFQWFDHLESLTGKRINPEEPRVIIILPPTWNNVDISSAQRVVDEAAAKAAVSNFILVETLPGTISKINAAIEVFFSKMNVTVTVRHSDNSKTDWQLINPFFSLPYEYVIGSAKDSDNKRINPTYTLSGVNRELSSDVYNGTSAGSGRAFRIKVTCKIYTVTYSYGAVGTGTVCYNTIIP